MEHPVDAPPETSGPREDADPWPIESYPAPEDPCRCEPPPMTAPPRRQPPLARPKDDGCGSILEILRCLPGFDEQCLRQLHKPKTPTKVKVVNLCGALPISERLAPMLFLVLRRFLDGVTPGNEFESKLHSFLAGQPADQRTALEAALRAYQGLAAGPRECAFETRFDDWPDDRALDPGFFARNLVDEVLVLGRLMRFGPEPPPLPTTGPLRPWEKTVDLPGEPGRFTKVLAPWPWICALSPVAHKGVDDHNDWFRNESSCVPGNIPRGSIIYFPHEFAWNCTTTPDPKGGQATIECRNLEPSGAFAECPGGIDYSVFDKALSRRVCLQIPQVDPGSEVGLRGLNFFSRNARVHIRKVDAPIFREIPPVPLSDWQPDTTSPAATATCAVRDHAFFVMPTDVSDGLNDLPLPPGRYALQLIVPNDVNYAVAGGGPPPPEFPSNEVLIDLQPNPNQRFQILTDEAYCYEETDGLPTESDEPWFRAMTATFDLPKAATKIPLPLMNRIDIMTTDDVDSGEWISFPGASLFNDTLGRKIIAIGVIGLEVDSEDAARKQIDDFWDAYANYFQQFIVQIGASTDAGVLGAAAKASIQAGTISGWLWASGAAMLAIVAVGAIYAAWAPADEIAIDSLTYTSRQLFELTDSNPAHVPPDGDFLRIKQLRTNAEPLGKVAVAGGTAAVYSERRHYRSTHENSHYSLVYRFKRI